MHGFMDYVQNAFHSSSSWNRDNSYGSITVTARALLDFPIPHGFRLSLSSLSSPIFATSYTLSNAGVVDGSLSYLYTSYPLQIPHDSKSIALRSVIQGYRQLQEVRLPDEPWCNESRIDEQHGGQKATLLYGHLHLPSSYLSALYLRRTSPRSLLKLSTVSSSHLKNGGTILALFSYDAEKYSTDCLFSTDGALLGVRGLWNFGLDPRAKEREKKNIVLIDPKPIASATIPIPTTSTTHVPSNGRFSAGCEVYYGLTNKSGGMSMGLRFATLPPHSGFPYTMTATLNPLMGNLSSAYAIKAGDALTLCSKFDFNVYSYESELQVGLELWRRRQRQCEAGELAWATQKITKMRWLETNLAEGSLLLSKKRYPISSFPEACHAGQEDENTAGVLKARVSQNSIISFLWEGRIKELLYSAGVMMDFSKSAQEGGIFRGVGIELAYCT